MRWDDGRINVASAGAVGLKCEVRFATKGSKAFDECYRHAVTRSFPCSTSPAALSMPCVFPGAFRVRVFRNEGGAVLVGAIELASPSNKDRAEERRAFAATCRRASFADMLMLESRRWDRMVNAPECHGSSASATLNRPACPDARRRAPRLACSTASRARRRQ